jgi:hypothetical protein
MNDKQANKFRMHRKVKGVFTKNPDISTKYPAIGASFGSFDTLFTKIDKIDTAGAKPTSGTFESKLELKESMANEVDELAAAAFAYANDKKDIELAAALDVTYSEVRYADDQEAFSQSSAVYDELIGLDPAELEGYMISAEDLINFKNVVELYHTNLQSTKGQDSVARTRQLAVLFREITDHLYKHLDKLVGGIKRKEPVFFDTYTNARVIHDLGKGPKSTGDNDQFE